MCDQGELMDGFDSVKGEQMDPSQLTWSQFSNGTKFSCNLIAYYGAPCSRMLDMTKNYVQFPYVSDQQYTCTHSDNKIVDPLPGADKNCWCGNIVDANVFYGLKNIGIRCSPQYDKSKTNPTWKKSANSIQSASPTDISHKVHHDDQFICGFDFKNTSGSKNGFDQVIIGVDLQFCELARCEDKLTAIANPDFSILIEPGLGGAGQYGENTQARSIFNNYMQNTDISGFCNIESCQLLSIGQNLFDTNYAWVDTEKIYLNQDPTQEFLYPSVTLSCQNRNITVTTGTFKLEASCTNNVDISLPLDLVQDQSCYASNYTGARSKFNFTSFQTLTSACQVLKYEIYQGQNSIKAPEEFRVTTFYETYNMGQINTGSFFIEVKDGENPYQYSFIIYAEAMGGSTYYSPTFTITTKCPDHTTYDFYTVGGYKTLASFVGADLVGDGFGASFNFPTWFPYLSKCTQVLDYDTVEVSPVNSVTYPSKNFCLSDKCPWVDFDVSTAQTLNFKIRVTHSQGIALSEQYTIVVNQDYQTPYIIVPAISSSKNIMVDQNEKFEFDPFMCSSGCQVSNYQVSSSGQSITAILGLSISFNSASGKFEVSLADTSFLQQVSFYIYGELQSSPSIFAFSNEVTLNVVCGSEQITFTQSSITVTPYELGQGIKTYLLSEAIQAMVASDKIACPITHYQIADMDSRVTFNGDSFNIDTSSSYVVKEYLTVSTSAVSKNLPITFIVCGNEMFLSRNQVVKMIVPKNMSFTISKSTYLSYFTLFYLASSSHQDCIQTEITSNQLKDESCGGTINSEVHYSVSQDGDIVFDTNYPFKMRSICLNLQTVINKKVQSQILEIEVLGSEIVTLVDNYNTKEIKKIFSQNTESEVISVTKSEGFSFITDSVNAPVTTYKLMLKDQNGQYTEYTSSQVTVDSSLTALNINVLTNKGLIQTFYLQASTQSSDHVAYLQVNIKVCGLETIKQKRSKNEINLSKTSISIKLSKKKLQSYFEVSDSDCPFEQFSIDSESDYNETFVSITPKDQLEFYPSLSQYNPSDEIFTLLLIGQTKGLSQGTVSLDIHFISPSSSNSALLTLQAPAFKTLPKQYEFNIFVGNFKKVFNQKMVLPEIVDPNGEEIVQIDSTWKLLKNGEQLPQIPGWLSLSWSISEKVVKIRYGLSQENLVVVDKEDEGSYTLKFELQNVMGHSRDEELQFELKVTNVDTQDSVNMLLEQLDNIYFPMDIKYPSDCLPEGLSYITSFQSICDPSQQGEDLKFCEQVLKDSLTLDSPEISDQPPSDMEPINQCRIKFNSQIFLIEHQEWLKNGGKLYETAAIIAWLDTKIRYEVRGIKFAGQEECSYSTQFKEVSNIFEIATFEGVIMKENNKEIKVEKEKVEINSERNDKQQVQMIDFFFFQDQQNLNTYLRLKFDKDIREFNELEKKGLAKFIKIQMMSGFDYSIIAGMYNSTKFRQLKEDEDNEDDKNEESIAEQNLNFTWGFNKTQQSANSLTLQLKFKNIDRVSQNIQSKRDSLLFWIEENNYIRDKEYNLPMQQTSFGTFNSKNWIEVAPLRVHDSSPLVSENVIKGLLFGASILQANSLVINLVLDKSLQKVWSLLSIQIISYHLMLLQISSSVPSNIYLFNSFASKFVQEDMHKNKDKSDKVIDYIFDFTQSESLSAQFEQLGYTGANFFVLAGPIILSLALIMMTKLLIYIILKMIKTQFAHIEIARKIAIFLKSKHGWDTIFQIYLQRYLALFMCTTISFKGTNEQELFETGSDKFSVIFIYISLLILILKPFGLTIFIYKNKDRLNDPDFVKQYGYIFSELSTRTPEQATFNLIYMFRRIMFVLIIVLMNNYCYLQVISHIILTITYAGYILANKPYIKNEMNKTQALNEISVLASTYILITLTDQQIDSIQRYKVGYFYIIAWAYSICYNLYGIISELLFEIVPMFMKKQNVKKDIKQYEKNIEQWLKIKAKNSTKSETDMEIYQHAELIVKIREQKKQLYKRLQEYESQKMWLVENEIPIQKMSQMAQEIKSLYDVLRSNIYNVEKDNKKSGIRWGQHFGGLNAILYSTKVIGSSNLQIFHHNSGNKSPPFNFKILESTVVKPFIKHYGHGKLPEYLEKQLMQRVIDDNQRRLGQYLEKNQYHVMVMKGDGNCGPRALSTRVFGNQKKHKLVRQQLCQYLDCHPNYWGNQRGIPNYQEFIKNKLQKSREWFTDTEFRAAAKFFNFPIVIFSGQYSTPFFDIINEALTFEGNRQEPLYIHHLNGCHFNFLAHKNQLQFYKDLNLVPFVASDFELPPMPLLKEKNPNPNSNSLQAKVQQKYKKKLKKQKTKRDCKVVQPLNLETIIEEQYQDNEKPSQQDLIKNQNKARFQIGKQI